MFRLRDAGLGIEDAGLNAGLQPRFFETGPQKARRRGSGLGIGWLLKFPALSMCVACSYESLHIGRVSLRKSLRRPLL